MGYVVALTAVILWGLVQIPVRLAKAPGRVGVMISLPVGVAAMLVILLVRGDLAVPAASASDWFYILMTGLFQFQLATFCYFEAVQRAGITTAAPITRLVPVLVVLASATLGLEPLSWPIISAALLIFIGGVFLAKGTRRAHPVETHKQLHSGMAYAAVACALWAVGMLCVDQVSAEIPRSLVVLYGLAFGCVIHWAVMTLLGRLRELRKLTRLDVVCYCTQGVVSFAVGYWAYFVSIRYLGLNAATVTTGCWPAVGLVAGIVVFREPMNGHKLLGTMIFILSGILAGIGPWLERFISALW